MGRIIVIDEDDLKGLISEAVTNAVDNVTKKITACVARKSYRNRMFKPLRRVEPISCGSSGGGCGGSYDYSYGGCGSSGGCGSTPSITYGCGSSGGCGDHTNGGC